MTKTQCELYTYSDVTSSTVNVYWGYHLSSVTLCMLTNCCVWNYTPLEMHSSRITSAKEFPDSAFYFSPCNIKYTSNVAAWFYALSLTTKHLICIMLSIS